MQYVDYFKNTGVEVFFDLMLPDPNNRPARTTESLKVSPIPTSVERDLGLPERWQTITPDRKPEPVPEIPIDENGDLVLPED